MGLFLLRIVDYDKLFWIRIFEELEDEERGKSSLDHIAQFINCFVYKFALLGCMIILTRFGLHDKPTDLPSSCITPEGY